MAQTVAKVGKSKKDDVRVIEKSKRKVQQIITDDKAYPPNLKGSKITKLISKLLSEAQTAKINQEGPVSLDRKLKLVDWACHRALPYFDTVYRTRLEQLPASPKTEEAFRQLNVICADICRYMSVITSIPRTDRELNLEERFKRDFWAKKAIAYYDTSNIPISSYDVRIRRMLSDSPLNLVLALLFSLRNLSRYNRSVDAVNATQDPSRTTNVERAITNIKDLTAPGVLFLGVTSCTEEIVNLVKHQDSGWPVKDLLSLDKALERVRKEWSKLTPADYDDDSADAVIFILVMLADLSKHGLHQPPRILMSALLKTKPLHNRVQVLINPDQPLQFSSQLLRYVFENTALDNDSFRTKIQRLNSRPADF